MELEEVKNKAIRGIIALGGRTVFLQATNLIAFFLLGIFLSPGAVGIFIAVSALTRIFTLFTDVGLGAALIQKKESLDKDDLATTFTIQALLVGLVVVAGFFLTPFVSSFANLDKDGIFLYQVLLLTLFISSLKAVPSILLERKLAFEKQVIPQIVEALVFNILVVVLAYKGFGVASYSWAILSSALVGLPIYYLVSPWRVSLGISWPKTKQLLSYGLAYQGKNVLAVIKDDLLTFFLVRQVGTTGLGYWGWAQRWAYSPFRLIVDSVTKVTFPAYSRIQHEREVLKVGIERSLLAISFVLFPILTTIAFLIGPLIQVIPRYSKWEPALPSFYLLCAGAAISALSNVLVNTLDATGRVKTTLSLMLVWIVLTWGLTVSLVAKIGFSGIALASFLVTLTIFLTIYLVNRVVRFRFWGSIYKPAVGCLFMAVTLFLEAAILAPGLGTLVVSGAVGGIIYLLVLFLIARQELLVNIRLVWRAYQK